MNPINLKSMFPQYRIQYESGGTNRRLKEDDIALQVMPCEYGHIFAWSGTLLAASLNGLGGLANRLRKLGRVAQDADDGITVLFEPPAFPAVAQILRPRLARSRAA